MAIPSQSVQKPVEAKSATAPPAKPPPDTGSSNNRGYERPSHRNRNIVVATVAVMAMLLLVGSGYAYMSISSLNGTHSSSTTNYNATNTTAPVTLSSSTERFGTTGSTIPSTQNASPSTSASASCTGQSGVIYVGGSTTAYPEVDSLVPAFEAKYCVSVVISQGGDSAGMQGIISGTYDIGLTSSYSAYQSAVQEVKDNGLVGVDPVAFQIGSNGSSTIFWMVTNGSPNGAVLEFIQFVQANVTQGTFITQTTTSNTFQSS
jgi:hypothetical protein